MQLYSSIIFAIIKSDIAIYIVLLVQ